MKTADAARLADVGEATIRQWKRRGVIPIPSGFVIPAANIPIDVHPVDGRSRTGKHCLHVPCCYCTREDAA